jgi:hypothetical protein
MNPATKKKTRAGKRPASRAMGTRKRQNSVPVPAKAVRRKTDRSPRRKVASKTRRATFARTKQVAKRSGLTASLIKSIPPILLEADLAPPPVVTADTGLTEYPAQPPSPAAPTAIAADAKPVPDPVPNVVAPVLGLEEIKEGTTPPIPSVQISSTGTLHLTARDSHWLHAHWSLPPVIQSLMRNPWEKQNLAVRLHKGAVPTLAFREVQPQPGSQECFLQVDDAGAMFVAELFWWDSQGKWVRLAASNTVSTPPEVISEDRSAQWMSVPAPANPASAPSLPQEVPKPVAFPEQTPAPPAVFVTTALVESPPVAPALSETATVAPPQFQPFLAPWVSAPARPEERIPAETDQAEPSSSEPPHLVDQPPAHKAPGTAFDLSLSIQGGPSSLDAAMAGGLQLSEEMPGQVGPFPGQIVPLPAAPVSSLEFQSAALPPAGPSRRAFWFNVNAELIIYGATEPDALVLMGERRIRLRPDGSFSYRFALPDGIYSLPIEAWSVQGDDCRKAELGFSRLTNLDGVVGPHPQDPALRAPKVENV